MRRRIVLVLSFVAGSLGIFAFFFPKVPLPPLSWLVKGADLESSSGRLSD